MDAKITDTGITLTAPEHTDELLPASTAATLMAENIEGRYGKDAEFAAMLRTAARFSNDVAKFEEAEGQFVDVLLLGMSSGWFARTLRRDHNKGGDPEDYEQAAEFMTDVWDTLFRQMGISAIGGRLEKTEHRYSHGAGEL